MSNKRFSIIIPTLNEQKYLPKLLNDLTKQTYQQFEVIVVDGNSDDSTVKQAKKYQNRLPQLQIIESSKRSVAHQRNKGTESAHGRYFLFIDADTRLDSAFLSGINYRLHESNADAFTTWCKADSNTRADKTIATSINIGLEAAKLLEIPGAVGAFMGVKRSVFKKIGGFDPTIPYAEDREFFLECHRKGFEVDVFRDPRYIFSLRRFRKSGKLKSLQQYARLYTKRFTKTKIDPSDYPMGGQAHYEDQKTQSFIDRSQEILRRLSKQPQSFKKLANLFRYLQSED